MSTPEEMIESSKIEDIGNIGSELTLLVGTYNKILSDKTPRYGNFVTVLNKKTGEYFDLPILRPSIQLSLHKCRTWNQIATRLSRVGPKVEEEWVKRGVKRRGTPLYFADRWAYQGYKDEKENSWLVFRTFNEANASNRLLMRDRNPQLFWNWAKEFNKWLKKKKSDFRIIRTMKIVQSEA